MPDTFNPNTLTFANCTERIKKALGVVQLHRNKIVTSRDPEVVNAFHALKCDGVPGTGARYSGKICEPGAAADWGRHTGSPRLHAIAGGYISHQRSR
jgi:hypothetical protein